MQNWGWDSFLLQIFAGGGIKVDGGFMPSGDNPNRCSCKIGYPSDRLILRWIREAMGGNYKDFRLQIIDQNTIEVSYVPSLAQSKQILFGDDS